MKGILGYIGKFIGLREDDNSFNCAKRDRAGDDDDDPPVMKKYKTVRSHFPKIVMPSDEEEWTFPHRIGGGPRVCYIPIVREDVPSTSTPASRLFEGGKEVKKSLGLQDHTQPEPSCSSGPPLKKPSFFTQRSASLMTDSSKLGMHAKSTGVTKQDLDRAVLNEAYRNRFSSLSPLQAAEYMIPRREDNGVNDDDNEDDDEIVTHEPRERERRFFKSKKSSAEPSRKSPQEEFIVLSDNEDFDVVMMKRPKSRNKNDSHEYNGNSSYHCVELSDEDDSSDDPPCSHCKPRYSEARRSFPSDYLQTSRQMAGRFKTPLSLSKAMRLNSITPFWKSQKTRRSSLGKTNNKRMSSLNLPSTTKAIIQKCFRLDDKKRYEELIRLSNASFSTGRVRKKTLVDMSETQKRIIHLTTNLNKASGLGSNDQDDDHQLQNGNMEKESPDDPTAAVVLSDSEPDQVVSADDASTSSSVRIDRVNSLRQSLQKRPYININWMEDLNKKYQNIQLGKKIQEKDCIIVSTTQSKCNREFWLKKKQQDINSSILDLTEDTEEPEEIPLPELTDEQQKIINNALRSHPPNQVLIEKFNLSIHRRDIQTLAGLNWLNDEVINFYMNLLMERSEKNKDMPKVFGMNTFFYPKLMQSGHAGLKRWTRKVDIFSHDLMLIPVHLGVHWCMSIIDFRKKKIMYFDSMGGKNMDGCDAILDYLSAESLDKRKDRLDTSEWQRECVKDIPQQMNGSDCGMFSCTFAEFLSRDAPISFSQDDMPYLRRKMVLEIVTGRLLM